MKIKLKKLILWFLTGIFVLNISGCSLFSPPAVTPPPSSEEVTEEGEAQILKVVIKHADGTAVSGNEMQVLLSAGTVAIKVEVSKTGNISSAVTVSSSDSSIASVSSNTVTLKKAGTAVITARSTADESKAHSVSIEIEDDVTAPPAITSVQIKTSGGAAIPDNALSRKLNLGAFDLSVDVVKTGEISDEATLTSSDTSVASVSGMTVTPKKVGTTVLTAASVADPEKTHSVTLDVAVADAVLSVQIKTEAGGVIPGNAVLRKKSLGAFDLSVSVDKTGDISGAVTLTSSKTSVATVSGMTVTPVAAGTATLTAKSNADATKTHSVTLTVPAEVLSVQIKKSDGAAIPGDAFVYSGSFTPFNLAVSVTKTGDISDAYTLTSSNTSVATVAGTTVTPLGFGITLLTATSTADTNIKHVVNLSISGSAEPGTLKGAYASYFPIGAAVTKHTIDRFDPARPAGGSYYGTVDLMKHYNSLVAESAMKWSNLSNARGVYHYDDNTVYGDYPKPIVDYAVEKNMYMRAHGLIWYKSTPQWVKTAGTAGAVPTKAQLYTIMQEHINEVVTHYAAIPNIYCWDVVNEALQPWINNQADYDNGYYRTGATDVDNMGSKTFDWYEHYGNSPEFIADAFKLARAAADAAGRPDIKLYYNDYNLDNPLKRNAMLDLVSYLKSQDAPIDGIGMQSHYNADTFNLDNYKESVRLFLATGLDVQSTEIDISMYSWQDTSYTFGTMPTSTPIAANTNQWTYNVSSGAGAARLAVQNNIYKEIFATLRGYALPAEGRGRVTGITFWTIGDEWSWLNWEPQVTPGVNPYRPAFAGLFDYMRQPKAAFNDIVNYT